MEAIIAFSGKHRFLSNFYHSPLKWEGLHYPTVEHAYQAAKCMDCTLRQLFSTNGGLTAAGAKHCGRNVNIRPDWNAIRLTVMKTILYRKFSAGSTLAAQLVATGAAHLVEGNWWHDVFWGECPLGNGENHLGKLLMEIRQELVDSLVA